MQLYPPFGADVPVLNPAIDKQGARKQAKALRQQMAMAACDGARDALAACFLDGVPWRGCGPDGADGAIIGGYWPVEDEMDPRPLLGALAIAGCQCALPVVQKAGEPLCFRVWQPGDRLEPGPYAIPAPLAAAAIVIPTLLLVPLLAFDRSGHRLGYGGGYYDRTIARLRAKGALLAVGLAYAGQEVAAVPRTAADQALNWVVTEREAIKTE